MNNYKTALAVLISALLLMAVSLFNGYPLYGGDTHAYVYVAFHRTIPTDRTPFYGMFIRFSSFWESLWYTIFAQSVILACLLTRYIQLLYKGKAGIGFILACVICIMSFTSVSWLVSCLMSDIFTPILLLGVLLYLFDVTAMKIIKILYILIIFIAISMHNSHFLIVCLYSLGLSLFSLFRRNWLWIKKSVTLFVTSVLFFVSMCCLNYSYGNGFIFSGASHMFIVAKFAESGILNEYLNDSCGKKKLNLCACKNDITPYPWDFMWPQAGSSLSNLGGWEKCKPEFNMIIHDVFTTPKYTKMFIEKAATSTIRQLTEIQDLGKPINMPPGHLERAFVKEYFDDEDKEFLRSKQNNDQIDPFIPNVFYYLFFALSSIWILLVCSQSANKQIFYLYLYIIAFLVVNAFVTSVFSTVSGRFQARIFWILPATNAILILKYFQKKYIDKIQLRD